jgi:transketolase
LTETYPVPVLKVGVADTFGRSGKVPPLLEKYGLTPAAIVAKVKAAMDMKK